MSPVLVIIFKFYIIELRPHLPGLGPDGVSLLYSEMLRSCPADNLASYIQYSIHLFADCFYMHGRHNDDGIHRYSRKFLDIYSILCQFFLFHSSTIIVISIIQSLIQSPTEINMPYCKAPFG